MGTVYLARAPEPLHRQVAIKVINPGMATREIIDRFVGECRALSLMNHEGIARIYDARVTDDNAPYLVMEAIDGISLDQYWARSQVSIGVKIGVFAQVCRALTHAHSQGIIHRDIKPSNVLVTNAEVAPRTKIIDFGVATALEGPLHDGTATRTGSHLPGTIRFMGQSFSGLSRKPEFDRRCSHSVQRCTL